VGLRGGLKLGISNVYRSSLALAGKVSSPVYISWNNIDQNCIGVNGVNNALQFGVVEFRDEI
jgi:hypothetical protein